MNTSAAAPADANPHVFDATQANFEADVLQASMKAPVLVDFWATWCGPCKALSPILDKLAAEYNGAFRLAKVDCDKEQALAGMFGVRSIPMVVLVKDGQLADGFTGALPEGEVRQFLTKHGLQPAAAAPEAEVTPAAAPAVLPGESPDQAVARLREAAAAKPDDVDIKLQLAQALLQAGDADGAIAELDKLPADHANDDLAKSLRSRSDFARMLVGAPSRAELEATVAQHPDDLTARDLLGVRQIVDGDTEAGLETFLTLLAEHRDWNDGQAKKHLVAAFHCIDDAALVGRYRRRMSSLLF